MAKKGTKALLVIGSFVVIGGVLAYFLFFRTRKKGTEGTGETPPTTGESSAYTPSTIGSTTDNPFKSSDELKAFQNWVINVKKDTTILGSAGADGKWGSKSRSAWQKYGKEYKPSATTSTKRVVAKISGTPYYSFYPQTGTYKTIPKATTRNIGEVLGNHFGREVNVTIPSIYGNKVFRGVVFYAPDQSANVIDKSLVNII